MISEQTIQPFKCSSQPFERNHGEKLSYNSANRRIDGEVPPSDRTVQKIWWWFYQMELLFMHTWPS